MYKCDFSTLACASYYGLYLYQEDSYALKQVLNDQQFTSIIHLSPRLVLLGYRDIFGPLIFDTKSLRILKNINIYGDDRPDFAYNYMTLQYL
jgi:hypothetical protein